MIPKQPILKLLDKWTAKRHKIDNYLYEFPNGAKLLLSINPTTIDFDFNLILKGGSYYEDKIGVPQGTAHFLEHMLCNPNKYLKNQKELNKFRFGNKSRPQIFANAATSRRFMYFVSQSNIKGAERAIKYNMYRLDYPLEKFKSFINKERKVILAEETMEVKEDRDQRLLYEKFAIEATYPEFAKKIIGTKSSIKSIKVNHLLKFHKAITNPKNAIFAIQTNQQLDAKLIDLLYKFSKLLNSDSEEIVVDKKPLPNEFKYYHFKDNDAKDMYVSFNYFVFSDESKALNYHDLVMTYLFRTLISFLGYNYLREKKNLIYGNSSYSTKDVWYNYSRGFGLTCSKENLPKVFDEFYNLIYKKSISFLKSNDGKTWLNSQISNYIFPRTFSFDSDYAKDIGIAAVSEDDFYKYDFEQAKKIAKRATGKELIKYITTHVQPNPMHIWVSSPYENEEIYGIIEQSMFCKKWKTSG